MNEQERLIFLADQYNRLKGLRLAPIYVFFIFSPKVSVESVGPARLCIFVIVCVGWFSFLNQYYARRYGRIEESRDQQTKNFTMWPMILPGLFAWYFILRGRHGPTDSFLLFLPAFLFSEGLSASDIGFRRSYYLSAGAIMLFVTLSALFPSMPGHHFFRVYQFMVFGGAMLTVSILDHMLLVRTFRQSAREIGG